MNAQLHEKIVLPVLAMCMLITVSSCRDNSSAADAALRGKIIGTWVPDQKIVLPDTTQVTNGAIKLGTDGGYVTQYTFVRPDMVHQQVSRGTWQIQHGFLIESLTNIDSIPAPPGPSARSKIMQLDDHPLVLSNEWNARRSFVRRQ